MLAFSDAQLEQIKTAAFQLPHHLRSQYLQRLAELLPAGYGDADVWRCAYRAARETMATSGCREVARQTVSA